VTYFGVLLRFIGIPMIVLAGVTASGLRRKGLPVQWRTWPWWGVLLGHAAIALLYTTPWDNYLVANRIWWYDPQLVTGITLGWVPIEEYTFFVVQTLLTGLWLLFWMGRIEPPGRPFHPSRAGRWISVAALGLLWALWLALLLGGWTRGRYMALLLAWFLPPILLQIAFGADILWHHRRLIAAGLIPPFLYLCIVDGLAIYGGTWTINPENTVSLDLVGILPLEEVTFFLITNVLIVFGMVLMLATESHRRFGTWRAQTSHDQHLERNGQDNPVTGQALSRGRHR
jgi:lycopene cyclase domain-containing protein